MAEALEWHGETRGSDFQVNEVPPDDDEIFKIGLFIDGFPRAARASFPGPGKLDLDFRGFDAEDELMIPASDFVPSGRKLKLGTWTPWAQVLCIDCAKGAHEKFRSTPEHHEPATRGDWQLESECDECGEKIWVDNKVAIEKRMVDALKSLGLEGSPDIYMQQTGGMCSAAQMESPGGESLMMLTQADEAMSEYDPYWCVGVYGAETADEEEMYRGENLSFFQAILHAVMIWTIWYHG